jgi:hypothetical protein
MRARHRGGIGFSYRPARLHRLAEFIPWHQFRGPIITINVPLFKKLRDIIFFYEPFRGTREMALKVIVPQKKNYVLKFLKQRDIGNFMYPSAVVYCCCMLLSVVGCPCVLLCVFVREVLGRNV